MHGEARILVRPRSGAGRDDRQVASALAAACQCPGPGASGRMGRRLRAATAAALSMRACRADLACPPGDWWSLGILVRAGPFAAVAAAACLPTDEVIGRSFILQPERTTSVGAPFACAPFDVHSSSSLRTSGLYFTLCAALSA